MCAGAGDGLHYTSNNAGCSGCSAKMPLRMPLLELRYAIHYTPVGVKHFRSPLCDAQIVTCPMILVILRIAFGAFITLTRQDIQLMAIMPAFGNGYLLLIA